MQISNAQEKVYEGKELQQGKSGKYIITGYTARDPSWYDDPSKFDKSTIRPVVSIDGNDYPYDDATPFFATAVWKIGADPKGTGRQVTRHDDSNCLMYFCGTDYENIWELGAEIEFTIENEKHIIDKPCAVYIPKGVKFGPVSFKKLTRPVMQYYILPDVPFYNNVLEGQEIEDDTPIETYPMYGGKWGKCIIRNSNRFEAAWYFTPEFDHSQYKDVVYLDAQALPGGVQPYTSDYQWKFKAEPEGTGHPNNYHINADEVICAVGSDWENPQDMGATLEFTIDGEKHIIRESCMFFFPRMVPHGPMWYAEVRRPKLGFFLLQEPFYFSENDDLLSYNDLKKLKEAEKALDNTQ